MDYRAEGCLILVIIFVLSLCLGWIGIPIIKKLRLGQEVRDDGPKSHLKKSGTPTFGGIFFLLPLCLLAIFAPFYNQALWPVSFVIILAFLFAIVGFIDDYIKVKISKKGFSIKQKTIVLLFFACLFSFWYVTFSSIKPFIILPFSSEMIAITGIGKYFYFIFVVIYIYACCNAVNLTDGVDGLAASVSIVVCIFYAIIGFILVKVIPSAGRSGIWLSFALIGGLLAFLYFNKYPAKVFMGDTGSQALGAYLAGIALIYGMPWLMLILGGIYVLEAVSLIIQVVYFRRTGGKRFFRMSPIHHHFELGGWSEWKIVRVFSFCTFILGLISLGLLYTMIN